MVEDVRKNKRAPVSLKVRFKSATVDEFIEQYSSDISKGGIFIKSKQPMPPGTLLKFEFQLKDNSPLIQGVGRVVWKRDADESPPQPPGMGIKFIKMDERSRAVVERIVSGKETVDQAEDEGPPRGGRDSVNPTERPSITADAAPDWPKPAAPTKPPTRPSAPPKRDSRVDAHKTVPSAVALHDALAKALAKAKDKPDSKAEEKKEEPKAEAEKEEPKAEEKKEEPKAEEKKEEPKAEEKKEEPEAEEKKEEPKAAAEKKEEPKAEEKKEPEAEEKEEPKAAAEKKEKPKAEEKKEEPKAKEKKEPTAAAKKDKPTPVPAARPSSPAPETRPSYMPEPEDERPGAWMWIGAIVILVGAAIGGYFYFTSGEGEDLDDALGHGDLSGGMAPAAEAGAPAPADGGAATPSAEEAGPATEEVVQLQVTSEPEGAEIYIGEERRDGVTPLELSGLPTGEDVAVEARLAGYKTAKQQVSVSEEMQTVAFKLDPLERRVVLKANVKAMFLIDGTQQAFAREHTVEKASLPFEVRIQARGHKALDITIGEDVEPWVEQDDALVYEHPEVSLERVPWTAPPTKTAPTRDPVEPPPAEKAPPPAEKAPPPAEKAPPPAEKAPPPAEKAPPPAEKAPPSTSVDDNPYD